MHDQRKLVHVKRIQKGKSAMSDLPKYAYWSLLAAAALFAAAFPMFAAADAPSLGTASNFAVLSAAPNAGGAVSCTWSVIDGDVGATGSVTQDPGYPCTITGTISAPVAATAVSDFNTAYDQLAPTSATCDYNMFSTYGGPLTLTPGVYCSTGDVSFTNATLTLDAQGDPNATWIFKIATDPTGTLGVGNLVGNNFKVVMINGGQYSNVYWWTAGGVTLTGTPDFQGTILSGGDVSIITLPVGGDLSGGATLFSGDVLAKGTVSLTNVTVTGINSSRASKSKSTCNQGVGNGAEGCDPGNSASTSPFGSNDENGGVPGNPGRKGGSK
jgi:Ice-binding-like